MSRYRVRGGMGVEHGGWTIYGNCLFSLDPATMKIARPDDEGEDLDSRHRLGPMAQSASCQCAARSAQSQKLANCPLANCALATDIFVIANVMRNREQPSGTFCYDPKRNVWEEVKTTNPIPVSPTSSWCGWVRMCYDSEHDCLIAMIHPDLFYAFRCVPPSVPGQSR